jgi:hypothetical protein
MKEGAVSVAKNMIELGVLVAATHGWDEARRFKKYRPSQSDKSVLASRARQILDIFPDMASACAMMSAAFAAHLERGMAAPVHLVAGALYADGERVFGTDTEVDGAYLFSRSASDWDGHVWVMIGGYVADISLLRTAYSRLAPPALSSLVAATFGPGKGMYFDDWRKTRRLGLRYEPSYVLPAEQVDGLLAGAHALIKEPTAALG